MPKTFLLVDVFYKDQYNRWVCEDLPHLRDFLRTLEDIDYIKVERVEQTGTVVEAPAA